MIDIGDLAFKSGSIADFGPFQALLLTHEHPDHAYLPALQQAQEQGIPIYANASVAQAYPEISITVVGSEEFNAGDFTIKPVPMAHSKLVHGADGPENTGYIIDGSVLHCGDSNEPQNFEIQTVLVAIAGPDISMKAGADVAKSLNAKRVIPMHYDNPVFYNDPDSFKERLADSFETVVLKPGESIEIS